MVFGAAALAAQTPERAAPPTWTDADLAPFFPDARAALVGDRPAWAASANGATNDAAATAPLPADKFAWSEHVSPETLDAEVKRIAARLEPPLANPAAFKSGGNLECRTEFAVLAVLFAVIDQYDGDVRWQRDAAAMRDAFARASANCKSASDQTYADAVRRRDELADLIRGGRLGGEAPPAVEIWSTLSDRTLLMQRMERAMQAGINPRLADARALSQAAPDVRHDAEVLAVLAEVIQRREYEFWDDDTFRDYARELGAAAADLSRAASEGDYEAARAAAGRATQSCAACHDGYRA
jgi:cytochrome c556